MNLVTLNLTQSKTPAPRWHLLSDMASILARLVKLDAVSRAERTLNRLPDELLADMGISRWEIAEAVRLGRAADRAATPAKVIALRRPNKRPDGGPDVPRAA
jgi:uncharacterized protein YjiS (DUF1127 family)